MCSSRRRTRKWSRSSSSTSTRHTKISSPSARWWRTSSNNSYVHSSFSLILLLSIHPSLCRSFFLSILLIRKVVENVSYGFSHITLRSIHTCNVFSWRFVSFFLSFCKRECCEIYFLTKRISSQDLFHSGFTRWNISVSKICSETNVTWRYKFNQSLMFEPGVL